LRVDPVKACSRGRIHIAKTVLGAVRLRWPFGLSPAEPRHGVRAYALENADLGGFGLLGLAVLVLIFRTNDPAVHDDMVALVKRV